MISYDGLINILHEKKINKSTLSKELGISSKTIAKINKHEPIAMNVLKKIASYLECEISDLYKNVSDNALLQLLREEQEIKLPGGLYHELQVRMTYNSNHIEGSKLSEEQTRLIFETNTINSIEQLSVDDIIETSNHFRAIDYIIDHAEDVLTENSVKEIHGILKQGTKDASMSWFAVGDYKKRANVVGGRETTLPKDVPNEMKQLLYNYNNIDYKTFEDIVEFHYNFERIHPFQDGNGRVERLIALKECLNNSIIPFIIEDTKKMFYYRGLSEWEKEKGYLIGTCLDGQDTFKKLMNMFNLNDNYYKTTT